jgi:hypothetical protein
VRIIETLHAPVTQQWQPAKTSPTGLFLRLIRKKRTIVYLIPSEGYFLTAFVFGEKATEAARKSNLPPPVIAALNAARVYAEGRGLRLETRTRDNMLTMLKLAEITMTL